MSDIHERYLRDTELADRYSIHRSSVHRWAAQGVIPRPVKIGGSTRWKLSELLKHEQEASQ